MPGTNRVRKQQMQPHSASYLPGFLPQVPLADRHADSARLQADVERLAVELAQARRPWWRLVGR